MTVTVTFEYAHRAPQTARFRALGTKSPSAAASRAVRLAKSSLHPKNWTSAVVLIDRADEALADEGATLREGFVDSV